MKVKQWEKPQVGVLALGKSGKAGSSISTGKARYHLGPSPTPTPATADDESHRIGKVRYHLGPAPTPLPDYMGPAPAPFLKR